MLYKIDQMKIKKPIIQNIYGSDGIYQHKPERHQPMLVQEYQQLAQTDPYNTPRFSTLEDLDSQYWKTINNGIAAIYGTDLDGSLMECKEWNFNNLNSILKYVEEDYGQKILGIQTPYVYFGNNLYLYLRPNIFSKFCLNLIRIYRLYIHSQVCGSRHLFGMLKTWTFMQLVIYIWALQKYGIQYHRILQENLKN